jgi:hypothetical protein
MENSTNVELKSEGSANTDINLVMEELKALKASNERLLTESKDWKSKYQNVSSEKSTIEKARLEKEGNFQALLEQEKTEKVNLEKKLKEREKSLLKTQARSLLAEVAKDAHDISDLLRLDDVGIIEYDEENLTVKKESVEKFYATVKTKKPWMFGEKKLPSTATGYVAKETGAKLPSEMNQAEQLSAMKNSLKNIL